MKEARVLFAGVTLVLRAGWLDITDDLPEGAPPTLARLDGIGALQLSVARYRSGAEPNIAEQDLRGLLHEFFDRHHLGKPTDVRMSLGGNIIISGDFSREYESGRVWLVSDGRDVALVTYTAQEPQDARIRAEISESDGIVASLGFL